MKQVVSECIIMRKKKYVVFWLVKVEGGRLGDQTEDRRIISSWILRE
jgi:hypothetical protein